MQLQEIESVLDQLVFEGELAPETAHKIMYRMIGSDLSIKYSNRAEWLKEHPEYVQEEEIEDKRTGDSSC